MTSRDYVYWLQGFFEISGTLNKLSSEQVKLIQAHLDMVFTYEIYPKIGFINWLKGYILDRPILKEEIELICKELNLVFLHEIDPLMGDIKTQNLLNEIHNNGKSNGKSNSILRC